MGSNIDLSVSIRELRKIIHYSRTQRSCQITMLRRPRMRFRQKYRRMQGLPISWVFRCMFNHTICAAFLQSLMTTTAFCPVEHTYHQQHDRSLSHRNKLIYKSEYRSSAVSVGCIADRFKSEDMPSHTSCTLRLHYRPIVLQHVFNLCVSNKDFPFHSFVVCIH